MVVRLVCLALALIASLPATGVAQNTASLIGTVIDDSKALLPGATVTATELSTGRQYVATADERGEYRLPSVEPGTYRIQVELSGFATVVVPRVELLVGQAATLPVTLGVATVAETVTITGDAPLVNTQSAVVGGNIDRRQMQELPILGRNWLEMSLLVKGITANSMAGNRAGAQRDDQFQLNVDGQQITQGISSSETFGQPRISREAIAEYQLSTSGYDVTQGRSVGITVQAISRSGTNDLHGSAFGNFRDDSLVAKDFIARRVLPYSNQQTGFSLGGPVIQNRLHYFGSYEYEREPNSALVNPQAWSTAPVSTATFPTKVSQHSVLARGDYQWRPADRVSVRGTYWTLDRPFGGVGGNQYPTAASRTTRDNVSINGSWTRVLRDSLVQEVRVGYTRYVFANQLGEGVPSTPIYRAAGLPDIGATNFYPQELWQKAPSVRYDLTWHVGTHDFKIGGEYLARRDGADWPNNTRGIFRVQGETAASWARRFPLDAWQDPTRWDLSGLNVTRFNVSFARDYILDLPRDTWALWAADRWQVSNRLTVNYGLRWDVDWGALDVPGGIDTPVIINNGFDVNLDAGTYTGTRDLKDIAPRGGVTYKVNDRLVIRGGAGLFYAFQDSGLLHGFQQQITNERRFITVDVANDGRPDFLTNPLNGATLDEFLSGARPMPPVTLRNISRDYVNPRTFQATLGFQQQIGQVLGFDADLLYSKGMHLGFDREVNLPYDPVTGFPKNLDYPTAGAVSRPNPQYASIRYFESDLRSENLALATSFTRRLHARWQAGGTYTLTFYNRDEGTNGFGYAAGGNNPFCQECEWGTTGAFQRHTVRLNGIYEAPWGIAVAAIYSFGSGTRNGVLYADAGVVSPVGTAGSLFAIFFPANRYVTGAPFTIAETVTYPDGSTHSNYERLVDGTPTSYTTGEQVPRNAFENLPISKLDVRLSKRVAVPGTPLKITGMFEVFNVFNHANYAAYNSSVNLPSFGRPTAAFEPRTVQLAFRVEF